MSPAPSGSLFSRVPVVHSPVYTKPLMACLPERCGAELDGEPLLFMALPGSDTLYRPAKILLLKTHQPSLILPLPPPPQLHLLHWNGLLLPLLLLLLWCIFSAILFPPQAQGCTRGRCHQSPPKVRRTRNNNLCHLLGIIPA
ncbi:Hypothetical predicted protein [Xyrichtys novacula]|uniref:Uncharacterized protein n=1 Tax=Xyrichtys novacula TaxID=13765 RepID=A0AAV1F149_XYRNO|nr:Hypothetical predicted protein [Xyrichtys novacula]